MGSSRLANPSQRFELTPRQEQVLALLAKGKTNPEIAEALGVSLDGAKYHVREILGKLGAENREQAVEAWNRERRPAVRLIQFSRGVVAAVSWRAAATIGLGVAGVGTAVLVLAAALSGDGDTPPAAPESTSTLSAATAAATAGPLAACDPAATDFRLEVRPAGESREIHLMAQSPFAPCQLTTTAQVTILLPSGEPADAVVNGTTLAVNATLPSSELVAGLLWSNWCQGAPPSLRLNVADLEQTFAAADAPACTETTFASKLGPLAILGAPSPTATPLPGNLTRVVSPSIPVRVAVYADARPGSTNCVDIIADMVPASVAGTVATRPFECAGDLYRLTFAADSAGLHYLLGVQLLLVGKATLPQPRFGDGTCDSIRDHLVLASESLDSAVYVLVCDVQPKARGASSGQTSLQIRARIVESLAPAALPSPDVPCWSLSRYLGSPGEGRTVDLVCTLE
jgi:DNA-binding CsgD family transcriptional regulator